MDIAEIITNNTNEEGVVDYEAVNQAVLDANSAVVEKQLEVEKGKIYAEARKKYKKPKEDPVQDQVVTNPGDDRIAALESTISQLASIVTGTVTETKTSKFVQTLTEQGVPAERITAIVNVTPIDKFDEFDATPFIEKTPEPGDPFGGVGNKSQDPTTVVDAMAALKSVYGL